MNQIWESRIDGEYFKQCKILRECSDKFREYYGMDVTTDTKCTNNQQIHFTIYAVFYSHCSHQHVSAAIATIFRVMLLLQQHKSTNAVSCVDVTSLQFQLELCK